MRTVVVHFKVFDLAKIVLSTIIKKKPNKNRNFLMSINMLTFVRESKMVLLTFGENV